MTHTGQDPQVGKTLRDLARTAPTPSVEITEQGLVAAIPELAALARTEQDPRWHPEGDVLVHSLWAADLAARHARESGIDGERHERLVLATLFHDIGKPETTRRVGARITSLGHAEVGADIVRSLGARLGFPRPLITAISAIVQTHMAHASVQGEPSPRAVRRLHSRLSAAGTSLSDWAFVVRCDGEARGAAARPDASVRWMKVARMLDL